MKIKTKNKNNTHFIVKIFSEISSKDRFVILGKYIILGPLVHFNFNFFLT